MRRNRMRPGGPKILRTGVTASVISRNRRVQSPVACVMYSIGFAPRSFRRNPAASSATGTRHKRNTSAFSHKRFRLADIWRSVVGFQIHAIVQRRNLVPVPVEHERLSLQEVAQPPLAPLAPAWMVHRRVYVRIESVLARTRDVPRRGRLLLHEPDLHDGFDA